MWKLKIFQSSHRHLFLSNEPALLLQPAPQRSGAPKGLDLIWHIAAGHSCFLTQQSEGSGGLV